MSEYRFLAIEAESDVAHTHELPRATAEAFAAQLLALGVRIAWTPLQVPPGEPTRPPRRERKAERRAARPSAGLETR